MFKLEHYNCEGYANLFNYNFSRFIYILHGDFENHFFNSFFTETKNSLGEIYYQEDKILNPKDFAKNEASVIFTNNNFIPYLTFRDNLLFSRKIKNEHKFYEFGFIEIFELLKINLKYMDMKVNQIDYLLEKKLAIAKSILCNDSVILVNLDKKDEYSEANKEIIYNLIEINGKIKKIFIISDVARHFDGNECIYLKYFHGFISEKILEE